MPAIYLDHAASTPLRPGVAEAMAPFLSGANPSAMHRPGRLARKALEDARDLVAEKLGAHPRELVFCSGGTEADNLAVLGAAPGRGMLTCATEHPAVLSPARSRGAKILNPRPDGTLDPAAFETALDADTGFASLMLANNETGVLHPIREIGRICRARGILLHGDAAQAIGHIPVDWKTLPVDLLSFTAHKFGGPRGAGVLLVRSSVTLKPLLLGGDHEGGRRPGTENVAAAVGLAEALAQVLGDLVEESARISALRDRLTAGLKKAFPDLLVHGEAAPRLPQIASLSLPGVDGSTLLVALDQEGLAVSAGSACHTGSADPSPVLTAMGVPAALSRGTVRLSLGHSSTPAEVDAALGILVRIAGRLKAGASTSSGGG